MTSSSSKKETFVKSRVEIGRLVSLISSAFGSLKWKRKPSKAAPPSETAETQLQKHENLKAQAQAQVRSYISYR